LTWAGRVAFVSRLISKVTWCVGSVIAPAQATNANR